MKIVTWNCSGALRNKTQEIDFLDADVLIVQECENPTESTEVYRAWAGDYLWTGTSKNKGIGVFARKGNKIRELHWNGDFTLSGLNTGNASIRWNTKELELFLPFVLNDTMTILSVWTLGGNSGAFGYVGQFWKYLQIHKNDVRNEKTLILGDFNSNKMWDKADRWWNHSDVIDELKEIGIESLYHYQNKEDQGEETTPTFFMYRHKDKPYHIDYVFASSDLLDKSSLTIGVNDEWLTVSDHMPLCVDISI